MERSRIDAGVGSREWAKSSEDWGSEWGAHAAKTNYVLALCIQTATAAYPMI